MPALTYHFVEYDREIVHYEHLTILAPSLITAPPGQWHYLGPVAVTPESLNRRGLVVKANVPDALGDVAEWRPVFIDHEGRKFSTWRGIPRNPEKYVVVGDFFVTGIHKPTAKQTEGIKAIRKDLIEELEPHHLIFKKAVPFGVLTLWNVLAMVPIFIATGAFVSSPGASAESKLGVLRFHVDHVQEHAE